MWPYGHAAKMIKYPLIMSDQSHVSGKWLRVTVGSENDRSGSFLSVTGLIPGGIIVVVVVGIIIGIVIIGVVIPGEVVIAHTVISSSRSVR